MTTQPLRIAVIGAGIGGLTAAVALRQRGFKPTVYEQASELGEVGAGLTISASATLALNALGLGQALAAFEPLTPHFGVLHSITGERLNYEQRDLPAYEAKHGASTRHVHRADLHQLLLQALPEGTVYPGYGLNSLTLSSAGVGLEFTNGQKAEADLVVACDGLKSLVRQRHFSPEPAGFTGYVAWRGLVDRRRLPALALDPHFAAYPSADKLFARYPLRRGELINYVAIARKPDFTAESWHTQARVEEVLAEFSGWHADVVDLIAATPREGCMCWALYTRQPLDNWISDRICLLGDAAHPMTPFYGMGAAMAIEDGLILARALEVAGSLAEGLSRYQAARLPRANQMQKISLQRAHGYMNPSQAEQKKAPAAGLANLMDYNPATVEV